MNQPSTRSSGKSRSPLQGILALAAAVIMLLAMTAGSAFAAMPLANSEISNQATATYNDGVGGPSKQATSNMVYTYVQQVASLTLITDGQNGVVAVGGTIYFKHTVKNTGNGNDTFTLASVAGGGTLSLTTGVYSDTGTGAGSALSPSQSTTLAPGESFSFYISATATAAATAGQTNTVTVTATSQHTPAVSASNTDNVSVSPYAVLTFNKYVSPGSGKSGDTLTYTIRYTNTGNNAATNVQVTDVIPATLTYVPGTANWTVGPTALTDATGDTQGTAPNTVDYSITGSTITAIFGQVLPGATADLTFQVTVNASLAPQTITNSADWSYYDGNATKTGTASVDFTVATTRTVVLDDNGSTTDSDPTYDVVKIASAPQGGTVWFDNVIHNTGNVADSYQMSVVGSNFPAGSGIQYYSAMNGSLLSGGVTPNIPAGTDYHVWVKVTLPTNASGGTNYTLVKKATSTTLGTVSDIVSDVLGTITAAAVDITNDESLAANPAAPGAGVFATGEAAAVSTTYGSNAAPAVFPLYLNNTSSTTEAYTLAASATSSFSPAVALPSGWTVTFHSNGSGVCSTVGSALAGNTTANVAGGSNVLVCAVVTPPTNALSDASNPQQVFFKATGNNTGAYDVKHDAVIVTANHNLTISPDGFGSISPNGSKVYTHTIYNGGNAIEGTAAGQVTLTTAETKAGWTTVLYYDTDNSGTFTALDQPFTDLHDIVGATGLAPGGSVTVFAKVQAPAGNVGDINATTITMTYNGGASTATATDTTTMQSAQLTIEKYQGLDADCNGTIEGSYVQSNITTGAVPGACIRYKLVVNNGGTQAATNLEVTDLLPAYTVYSKTGDCFATPATPGSTGASSTDATAVITEPAACATSGSVMFAIPSFAAGASADMYFEVQINK